MIVKIFFIIVSVEDFGIDIYNTQKYWKNKKLELTSFFLSTHHIFEFLLRKLPIPVFVISCKDCLNLQIEINQSPAVLFHLSTSHHSSHLTCFWVNFLVVLNISCLVTYPSLFRSISLKAISALCCCCDLSFSWEDSIMDTISALLLLRVQKRVRGSEISLSLIEQTGERGPTPIPTNRIVEWKIDCGRKY